MNVAKVLPMTFVMIAGPQILSAIFLATTENWRRNSAAYVLGALCSITIVVTIGFILAVGASGGGPSDGVYLVILALLGFAAIHTYRNRAESEPPKWMGRLQEASPGFSFKLGFLLLGIFPTDIVTSVAVGSFLANEGDPWWHCLPFIALTILLLALPSIALLLLRQRGEALLPKVRDWMNDNSWVVNELVLGLFVLLILNNLL